VALHLSAEAELEPPAGTGTLTLSNENTYAGGTWIQNDGTLTVKHSQALGVGDLNLVNGTLQGDLLPINVGGNYTQSADGTLDFAISATNRYDRLEVAGAATLDGVLSVRGVNAYLPLHSDLFVVLSATGGVAGTFATFTNTISHSVLLDPELIYNPNDVTLQWTQLSFVPFAMTRNQTNVALYLDTLASSTVTSIVAVIDLLDYAVDLTNNLPVGFDLIAPEELTAMFTAAFAGMDAQGNRFLRRATELRADYRSSYRAHMDVVSRNYADPDRVLNSPWAIYGEGGGKFATVDPDDNAGGYDLSSGDFTIGADRWVNDQLIAGMAASYHSAGVNLTGDGEIDVDSYRGQFYAVWFNGGFHAEGMLGAGLSSYHTERSALNGTAMGDTDGVEWNGLLGGGYDWRNGNWIFGPQAVMQYMSASIDGFTEKGSMAPLQIESETADALHTQLGVDLRYRGHVYDTLTFVTPEVYLAWRHEYLDDTLSLDSRLPGGGGSFTVYGPEMGQDSFVASLGLTIQWTPTVSTYFNYTAQLGQTGYDAHALNAGARISL
jgi:outer membrane autotransporter protein